MSRLDSADWDTFLAAYPDAHILQSSAWGVLKSGFGWNVERLQVGTTGAQVLFRHLPLGFSMAYLPKGPVGENWQSLWPEVDRLCYQRRAVVLKVEPDGWEECESALEANLAGFQSGGIPIQPRRTIVIDLTGPESAWLERMKQKTRYNIRLAERKDIIVRASNNIVAFYAMMKVTGSRDGFGVHALSYYQKAFDLFHQKGKVELLMAEYQGNPLAGLMVFAQGKRAWYFYGASSDEERSRMPTYLLQWQAMRWAKEHGCDSYDLWGVPDVDESQLEAQFEQRHDGLWGVYRFKRGFGGQIKRAAQTWERVYIPPLYAFYRFLASRRQDLSRG